MSWLFARQLRPLILFAAAASLALNVAMRAGKYADETWNELTGKSAAELGDHWKQSLLDSKVKSDGK